MAEQSVQEQYWTHVEKRPDICTTSRESVKGSIIHYDIKHEKGYDGDDWQRMCRYKIAEKDGFDCDVAQLTVLQYVIAFPFVLDEGRSIVKQADSILEYETRGQTGFAFRGDTMNSYATTVHEFIRRFGGEDETLRKLLAPVKGNKWGFPVEYASWETYILQGENYGIFSGFLSVEAKEFIRVCHTIGNFIPVPFIAKNTWFNSPRGVGPIKDYWDLTLWHIYLWYQLTAEDEQEEADAHLLVIVKNDESVKLCKEWLTGFRSWTGFVRANYLEPFVHNHYGSPKELWSGHLESPTALPEKRREFVEFFRNSSKWILERGERIAEVIMQELELTPGCHPWKEDN